MEFDEDRFALLVNQAETIILVVSMHVTMT